MFGTKRVYIRVENNKIVVRVGGGYLSIDEFIDQYTPSEIEKLARQDPLKKISEKVVTYLVKKAPGGKDDPFTDYNGSPRISVISGVGIQSASPNRSSPSVKKV